MNWLGQAGGVFPELTKLPRGYRFSAEIINHAVWLNHVLSLSLTDVKLILAERGMSEIRFEVRV